MKKYFSISFIVLILVIASSNNIFANQREFNLPVDENIKNAAVLVEWTNSVDLDIELISPSGKTLNKNELKDAYVKRDKNIMVFLNNPELGNWKVVLSRSDIGEANISLNEITDLFEISKFDVEKISESRFRFSWEIKNAKENSFSISIYANKDSDSFSGAKIKEFNGKPKDSIEIDIDNIDYDNYYFYIKAENSLGVDDYLYFNKANEVRGRNTPDEVSNIKASVVDNSIKVEWEGLDNTNNNYKVMLFNKGENRPFLVEETSENYFITPPLEENSVEVAVTKLGPSGLSGKYKRALVDMSKSKDIKAEVKFPKEDITNKKSLLVPLEMEKGLVANVYVNGEVEQENILNSGIINFQLIDGKNELFVIVEDKLGNAKTFSKTMYVDTYPPHLSVTRDYRGIYSGDRKFIIAGQVEPNAKLYLNDKELEYEENGIFAVSMPLSFGNNRVVLKAVDLAGNTTYYHGNINRILGVSFIYIIVTIIVIVLSVIFMIYLYKKKQIQSGEDKDVK